MSNLRELTLRYVTAFSARQHLSIRAMVGFYPMSLPLRSRLCTGQEIR